MPDIIPLIQSHQWPVLTGVLLLLGLRVVARYKADFWGKIPPWARFAFPVALEFAAGFGEALQQGQAWGAAALAGGAAVIALLGLHHGLKLKRLTGGAAKVTAASAALLMLSCQPVKDASDWVQGVCEGYLAATPQVQAEAQARGVSPIEIASMICLLNDAGRVIYDWFAVPAPNGMRAAAPPEDLADATEHALFVARREGVLR